MKILLSINPEHVENILQGTKRFEFRKVKCKNDVKMILIYSTSPVMKVVAEVEVKGIIENDPELLWEVTSEFAGISKNFFDKYYQGKNLAIAYELGEINIFKKPKSLEDFGINFAPQSFVYIN